MKIEDVTRTYSADGVAVHALRSVSMTINRGEFTAIAGPSGSGKTTLLNVMSGLDSPTTGKVILADRPVNAMKGRELSDFRRDHIGFIFQAYNLIPVLTVRENIEYIMLLQGIDEGEMRIRVEEILSQVGLEGMGSRRPSGLSGGQQQRVAIARAIVSRPDIILAEEPTANLDSLTGSSLIDMMRELNRNQWMTFVFSTHDTMIMERAARIVVLKEGMIDRDEARY